jgi:Trk-type K+ transport system membrane component
LILFILTITEDAPLIVLLFEVISAFGTVGMTMGITPDLSPIGKVLIAVMMFTGRVVPLTLTFALAKRNDKTPLKYVEKNYDRIIQFLEWTVSVIHFLIPIKQNPRKFNGFDFLGF